MALVRERARSKTTNNMNDTHTILGIDPQVKNPAFAFIDTHGKLVTYFKSNIHDVYKIESIRDADFVCIEDQYVSKNVSSAIKLARATGIIYGMLVTFIDKDNIEYVYPKTWQTLLRAHSRATRDQLKQRSKLFAYAVTGHRVEDQDICDAIMIAEWKRQRIREKYVRCAASV